MILRLPLNITKEYILSKVSEEDLIEYYLGYSIPYDTTICSPLRVDNNPSFSFTSYNGKIYWKDWGTGDRGDCFSFVGQMENNKGNYLRFNELLDFVYRNILPNIRKSLISKENAIVRRIKRNKLSLVIKVEEKIFSRFDLNYWNSFGIDRDLLKIYDDIVCCNRVIIESSDNTLIYYKTYDYTSPIYAYKTYDTEGNLIENTYKIYFPFEDKANKWRNNCPRDTIYGLRQLEYKSNILIITKSLKDVVVLKKLGYESICFGSENYIPDSISIGSRYSRIYLLFDNDVAGIKYANKFHLAHNNVIPIFLPDKNTKDISEFVYNYGIEGGKKVIRDLIRE